MVEHERFGGKRMEKGGRERGRQDGRINMRAAILESRGDGDGGEPFSAPLHPQSVERESEKRFSE
jgi:hypothetical protein